jgi:GT2 family glycosyltransferase
MLAPVISVIIPDHNASASLRRCLEAISTSADVTYECIVVDDGSNDGSQKIAREYAGRVLKHSGGPFGPAHARNRGAEVARGSILLFVDSDVVLAPGAMRRVAEVFQNQRDVAAVFGSYDASPMSPGVISQYRNLLHHFVHQNGNCEASTFWAGCGAIRRSVFAAVGGFDEKRFLRPSIEDIELGYRLRQAGYRIVLDKTLQATHLKEWTLRSLIRTDIVCRALPWSRLILETKKLPNDLNLKLGQRASFFLVAMACVLLILTIGQPQMLAGSAAALLGVTVLNRDLYTFFFRQRGLVFAATCIALHLLYYLYSGLSYLCVWSVFRVNRIRMLCRRSAFVTQSRSERS